MDFIKKESEIEIQSKIKARFGYISTSRNLYFEEFEFESEEIMDMYDKPEDARFFYRRYLKEMNIQLSEDEDGESRIVKFDVKFGVVVEIYQPKKIVFLNDLFFTNMESTVQNADITVVDDSLGIEKKFKVNTTFEGVGEYEEIYICSSEIICDFESIGNNELSIFGNIKLKVILFSPENQQITKETYLNMQFAEKLVTDMMFNKYEPNIRLNLVIDDVMVSGLGRERLECEVVVIAKLEMFSESKISVIEDIETGQLLSETQSEHTMVRLYYTAQNDNLWNICKKYKVRREDLELVNEEIDFENLNTGVMILLP
jgi:hypothetical protein